MYLALIPQFIDARRGHIAAQGFTLGALQIAVSVTVNALIILAAGSVARFVRTRPSWTVWQRRMTGTLLGGVAVVLAREVPRPRPRLNALALALGEFFGQLGGDGEQVADDTEVGQLEDGRLGVLVDRDDRLRGLHAGAVLDRTGNARLRCRAAG